jgi:hypothetical protein
MANSTSPLRRLQVTRYCARGRGRFFSYFYIEKANDESQEGCALRGLFVSTG